MTARIRGKRLYRRSARLYFIGPATRNEALFADRMFRPGRDQTDRSYHCSRRSDGQVAQRTAVRGALIMMMKHHSCRERQYQHDQQGGNDDSPNPRAISHCQVNPLSFNFFDTAFLTAPMGKYKERKCIYYTTHEADLNRMGILLGDRSADRRSPEGVLSGRTISGWAEHSSCTQTGSRLLSLTQMGAEY